MPKGAIRPRLQGSRSGRLVSIIGSIMIERLRKRSDFVAAASGRRFRTPRLTVQVRQRAPDGAKPAETAPTCRIGFTVTKREGGAVARNRIKRRLRAAVHLLQQRQHMLFAPGSDIVIIGRRDVLSVAFPSLLDDINQALSRPPRSGVTRNREGSATTPRIAGGQTRMQETP